MTATTKRMQVANEAFLLDRLAADAPRAQLYRELTQNAIEAIQRRMVEGDERPGLIQWDVDWLGVPQAQYKLCVIDNGDGMSALEMQRYLNSLAVQGANNTQSLTANFGVGAKITALFHNKLGLIYLSWREGRGHMVELHRDDDAGVYGLKLLDDKSGVPTYVRPMSDAAKPAIVSPHGTKVILLGNEPNEETWRSPKGIPGGETNWLYKYLNSRYFRLPENITLQVRNLRRDPQTWPLKEPPPADQTLNFETIRGMKEILDRQVKGALSEGPARAAGIVRLSDANVHWWLFEDRDVVDKAINPRAIPPGHVGIVFQDELYTVRTGNLGRKLMALFGVLYGADGIVLYVEPRESAGSVHADTGRSRVLVNGQDADSANLWARWGEEFREEMPPEIEAFIQRLLSKDDDSTREERRQRILERLQRIRELLNPSRYRRAPSGTLFAYNDVTGGSPVERDEPRSDPKPAKPGKPGGRKADDYLAQLAEEMGDPAEPVNPRAQPPEIRWVSLENGLRTDGLLEDRAGDIPGDVLKGDVIRLNEDFRGFRDLFDYFVREVNAEGDDHLVGRVYEVVKEWIETQALEIVTAVRGLEGTSFWTPNELELALSPEAITTGLMGRYFVIERVRRVLGSEFGKQRAKAVDA